MKKWLVPSGLAVCMAFQAAGQVQRLDSPVAVVDSAIGPQVEESTEVASLLRTASDAVDREDWKLAIDSLQRVIESPAGLYFDNTEPTTYRSPRRAAERLLASLPAEGLEAYRILYDGRAKGLSEQARRDHDLNALRRVCNHFLLTRHGASAAMLLSSWLIDLGQEAEALVVLDELAAVYPGGEGLLVEINLQRAVAAELLGDAGRALEFLENAGSAATATMVREFVSASRGLALSRRGLPGFRRVVGWSGAGGGVRNGVMDAVTPSLASGMPWRQRIPSALPDVWPDLERPAGFPPVMQPVAADGRLFVSAGRECIALDLSSFVVLWKAERDAEGIAERAGAGRDLSGDAAQRLIHDYVTGSLSTSHGLVLTIERGDAGPTFGTDGLAVLQRGRVRRTASNNMANRLVAYDAATGLMRWERGRGGDSDERLRKARFLAPPIGVGESLWVPFATAGDLYVGVIDPADGVMTDRVFLCALGDRPIRDGVALLLTADGSPGRAGGWGAGGAVYVPTDHGLLFSIDAETRQIRWATRYREEAAPKRSRAGRLAVRSAEHWLSGPPVVTGGYVLLGPTDYDWLLAFDRVDGRLRWGGSRLGARYIIAADRDHVWLGGGEVSLLSLESSGGSEVAPDVVWSVPISDATGRAVLSGSTIYVPTGSALLALDGSTGELIERYNLPGDQPPLGNLLCVGDSMISLDTSEVRAFPDRNSYDATLAAHAADVSDPRMAIRLAFMELLRRAPERALDALDGVRFAESAEAASLKGHAAHLRVEALKRLGENPGVSGDEAVAYLRRAVRAAEARGDRISASETLGRKLRGLGRFKEAYLTLFSLSREVRSDDLIESGAVKRAARLAIGEVLRRIEPELGRGETATIIDRVREVFEAARARLARPGERLAGGHALMALAESEVLGGWDQAALNELGRFEIGRGKYERGEQYLRESVRRSRDASRTAQALLLLLDLYLEPSQAQDVSAREIVRRLETEFSRVTVDGTLVGTLLSGRRVLSPGGAGGWGEAFEIGEAVAFPGADGGEALALISLDDPRPEALGGRSLFFRAPRTVRCYDVAAGSLEWEADLLMPGDFSFGGDGGRGAFALPDIKERGALFDGQTALIQSREGLHAVGVITGRRLWAIPHEGGARFGDPAARSRTTDVRDGRVACLLAPRSLAVLRAVDGETIWRRTLQSQAVGDVVIGDDLVLTADFDLETVRVFRLSNGEAMSEITFRSAGGGSDDRAMRVRLPIVYSEGILCGADAGAIVGFDARTGRRAWSLELRANPVGLLKLKDGMLVVSESGGRQLLVDAASGDVMLEATLESFVRGARDGVMDGDLLILASGEDTKNGYRWSLAGIEAAEDAGEVRWRREFVGKQHGPQLHVMDGVIPTVSLHATDAADPATSLDARAKPRKRSRQGIMLIDKQTGDLLGDPVFPQVNGERLTGEMAVLPGVLLLQTSKGIVTVRTTPRGGSGAKELN